jgi:hypothetical protein
VRRSEQKGAATPLRAAFVSVLAKSPAYTVA